MAFDAYMDLKTIKGESAAKGFEGQCELLSWSWGLSQSGTMHSGTGGGAGKVNVQDLSITKWVDAASPALILACCKGTHFDILKMTIRKAGGSALDYVVLELKECIVSSLSVGGSGGEDRLTENVTFNFASFKYVYQEQDKTGAKKGGPKEATYDIAKVS